MKLIIPIAGSGKRMRPHTWTRPKALINVGGKPMLSHILDQYQDVDIDEVVLIVGWLGDQIRPYVEANYPQYRVQIAVQEPLEGQSHALWLAREYIAGPCFIVFGDTIAELNHKAMVQADADVVLGVWQVEDPRRFGVAFLRSDGTVERLVEKPATTDHKQAIMGVYFVRRGEDLIAAIDEQIRRDERLKGEFFLTDAFNKMIENGARFTIEPMQVWQDCGTPPFHLETNRWLLDHGQDNQAATGAKLVNSEIRPPVHLADDVVIEGSTVGPYAVIESGCKVTNSRIQDTILMKGSQVVASELHDSLVGERVVIRGYKGSLNVGDDCQVGAE